MKPRSDDYGQREAAAPEPKNTSKLIHYNSSAKNQPNDQKRLNIRSGWADDLFSTLLVKK